MKRTLYLKLLLGYAAFGVLGFLTIATFTSRLAFNYIKRDTASDLYRESNLLASSYASNYYRGTLTLEDVTSQFQAISTYLDAAIQVISNNGQILIHAGQEPMEKNIEDFDITMFGTSYYQTGTFFGTFPKKPCLYFPRLPLTIK